MFCKGYFERINDEDKRQVIHTRQISWMIYQANADPKKAVKNINEWWPLTQENKKKAPRITKKERATLLKLANKIDSKNG